MNPDSNADNADNADNPELSALRNQVFVLLIALIVVSGTLTVYLYRQASILGKDIDAMKLQTQQLVGAYNQNKNLMIEFVNQLVAYGQTHPEFRPVLMKYGITPPPPGAVAPTSSVAPVVPITPVAPKK